MENTIRAVKYMISVWDEATGKTWRDSPDHVQKKFLEAEKEFSDIPEGARIVVKIFHSQNNICTMKKKLYLWQRVREVILRKINNYPDFLIYQRKNKP